VILGRGGGLSEEDTLVSHLSSTRCCKGTPQLRRHSRPHPLEPTVRRSADMVKHSC